MPSFYRPFIASEALAPRQSPRSRYNAAMPNCDELDRQWQANEGEPDRPSGLEAGIRRLRPVWIVGGVVMWGLLFAKIGWAALWLVIAILLIVPLGHVVGGKIGVWLYPRSGTD
jgi:hypothetical protein